jgi:hypothetical protein
MNISHSNKQSAEAKIFLQRADVELEYPLLAHIRIGILN